jgi:hypothetical protein
MLAADRLHCSALDLDSDEDATPFVWRERALLARECEQQQQEAGNRRQRSKERTSRVMSGQGRFQRG